MGFVCSSDISNVTCYEHSCALIFIQSSSFLQETRTTVKSRMSLKFRQIRRWTVEEAALERLKKSPYTNNGRNVVNTIAPSFLILSSSFLQVTRTKFG